MKKFYSFFFLLIAGCLLQISAAFGQIAQRGAATNGNTTNSTLTINKPTGVVSGDLMIVTIAQVGNNGTNPSRSGWTLIAGADLAGQTARRGAVLYRVADGTEGSSFAFTLGSGVSGATGSIIAFSGVNVSGGVGGTPFDVTPGSILVSNGGTVTATGITTATANAAVVMLGMASNGTPSYSNWSTTSPGTLTELFDNAQSNTSVGGAWAIKSGAGATGNGTASLSAGERNGGLLIALRAGSATPTVSITPATTQNILEGAAVSFTATANSFGGSGNYSFQWTVTPSVTLPGANPESTASNSSTKNISFSTAGTYTVNVTVSRTGASTLSSSTVTVKVNSIPSSPNLWASSSSGTQISAYTVVNGLYVAGPTNVFAASFPGTTTGGTSTAALGRNDKPSPSAGYFYWLPNTSGNGGVVEVFAATAAGATPTRIGSVDLNGGSTNSLGFVRLGMGPDGTGWILAGDGTTLYMAYFMSNGISPVSFNTKTVTLSGGSAATFQNGDVCVSGNNTMFALANDGSGVTQIFIGTLSNPTVTLTKKWDLVDETNTPFTGSVNGVAFDLPGSLYISTADGLYYINQATVNGPAGTVQCSLVQAQTGLQDLASNVFPANSTLPVTMGTFSVSKNGNNALLNWNTLTELNSDHFSIERSADGIHFTEIGTQRAAGNSSDNTSYQYTDALTTLTGVIYYRIKTVDINGSFEYSKIVPLRLNGPVKDLTVYPNPFTSDIRISINSTKNRTVTLRVSNAAGQAVISRMVGLQQGDNIIVLARELESLSKGVHVLELISEEGKQTMKIIKR